MKEWLNPHLINLMFFSFIITVGMKMFSSTVSIPQLPNIFEPNAKTSPLAVIFKEINKKKNKKK